MLARLPPFLTDTLRLKERTVAQQEREATSLLYLMAVADNPRHAIQHVANGRLQQTFEIAPMPRKASGAVRHSAGFVQKAIAVLLPLTQPKNARPSEIAIGVAELLQQCLSKLLSLEAAPDLHPRFFPIRNRATRAGMSSSMQGLHGSHKGSMPCARRWTKTRRSRSSTSRNMHLIPSQRTVSGG